MHFVYILQSNLDSRYYYGFTSRDPGERLKEHNMKSTSGYTKKYQPWVLLWYGAFRSKQKAEDFEMYLKGGSGHAFSRKRLI